MEEGQESKKVRRTKSTQPTDEAQPATAQAAMPEIKAEPEAPQEEASPKEIVQTIEAEIVERGELIKAVEAEVPQLFKAATKRLVFNETPRHVIKQRKGRGGLMFDYVDVNYVIEQLNHIFGFRWSHEVSPKPSDPHWNDYLKHSLEIGQFIVVVRLTVPCESMPSGVLVKEESGRAEIKKLKEGNAPVDVGNDFKAAESDALKRCASRVGVALDVYSGAATRRQDTEHPEGQITENQRKRLEVLAGEAGIGHSGLKKIIAEMYDYESTKQIKRKHFQAIQTRLEQIKMEQEAEPEMPDDIKQGFEILGTPKAKRIASWKAYSAKGEEGIAELKRKMSAEIDRRASKEAAPAKS